MAAALSDTARLRRVFELELERGCDNGAVIGGIDRLLIQMDEDGLLDTRHPLRARMGSLPAAGYRSLAVGDRQAWLRQTIRTLADSPLARRAAANTATTGRERPTEPSHRGPLDHPVIDFPHLTPGLDREHLCSRRHRPPRPQITPHASPASGRPRSRSSRSLASPTPPAPSPSSRAASMTSPMSAA